MVKQGEIEQFNATDVALREVYNYYNDSSIYDSDRYEDYVYSDYDNDDYLDDLYSGYGYTTEKYPDSYNYYDDGWELDDLVAGSLAFISATIIFIGLAFVPAIITLIAKWSVFKKADVDGWEALIPGHSEVVELKLSGIKTYWYFLNIIVFPLFAGPIVLAIWKSIKLSHSFGKGTGFGVGLAFLPCIFYPILAWGTATYVGPQNSNGEESIFYKETNSTQNYAVNNQPNTFNQPQSVQEVPVVKTEPVSQPQDNTYIEVEPKDNDPIQTNYDNKE